MSFGCFFVCVLGTDSPFTQDQHTDGWAWAVGAAARLACVRGWRCIVMLPIHSVYVHCHPTKPPSSSRWTSHHRCSSLNTASAQCLQPAGAAARNGTTHHIPSSRLFPRMSASSETGSIKNSSHLHQLQRTAAPSRGVPERLLPHTGSILTTFAAHTSSIQRQPSSPSMRQFKPHQRQRTPVPAPSPTRLHWTLVLANASAIQYESQPTPASAHPGRHLQ
jgi:hypothetical protein